jgi:hypothetical protein
MQSGCDRASTSPIALGTSVVIPASFATLLQRTISESMKRR